MSHNVSFDHLYARRITCPGLATGRSYTPTVEGETNMSVTEVADAVYTVSGYIVTVSFRIKANITGTPAQFSLQLPNGYPTQPTASGIGYAFASDNTQAIGFPGGVVARSTVHFVVTPASSATDVYFTGTYVYAYA